MRPWLLALDLIIDAVVGYIFILALPASIAAHAG